MEMPVEVRPNTVRPLLTPTRSREQGTSGDEANGWVGVGVDVSTECVRAPSALTLNDGGGDTSQLKSSSSATTEGVTCIPCSIATRKGSQDEGAYATDELGLRQGLNHGPVAEASDEQR
jgi:hypothetical protein